MHLGYLSFFMSALMIPGASLATDSVAVFNMQKIIQESTAGKKVASQLEADAEKKKKDLKQKEDSLQKKAQDFEKKKAVLSEKAQTDQQMDLQKEFMALREEANKTQADFAKKQRELLQPLFEKVQKAISQIAAEKKYNVVLEKSEHSVSWSSPDADITTEIIQKAAL